jgi:hypothetical protein
MRTGYICILPLIVLILSSVSIYATQVNVSGRIVKSAKGAVVGVSKVSISLTSKTDAERIYIVMSSRKGNFVFADVPEGDYTLTVWLRKYGDSTKVITKDITISAAKNTGSVSIGSIRIN